MSRDASAASSPQQAAETNAPRPEPGRAGSPGPWRRRLVQTAADGRLVAVLLSVALHALVFALAGNGAPRAQREAPAPKPEPGILYLAVMPAPPKETPAAAPGPTRTPVPMPEIAVRQAPRSAAMPPAPEPEPAFMAAPPAPTAQDWALAGKYTLKNSKRYRYTWGQQVRSMMGTAVQGPGQGMVRLQVEIAPDGRLARLETIWSTSALAEQLARKAIESLPPLPPTPTGKPLIFEKTIAFEPWASEGPPIYANDCLPDPPAFRNRYAWNGSAPPPRAEPAPMDKPDPKALADCLKQLPRDSVDAEGAHDQRQLDQWDSPRLGR